MEGNGLSSRQEPRFKDVEEIEKESQRRIELIRQREADREITTNFDKLITPLKQAGGFTVTDEKFSLWQKLKKILLG